MRVFVCWLIVLVSATACYGEEILPPAFPDGTVVIWENGTYLNVVQRQTGSNKTHAAIVFNEGNRSYVYESSKPDVHRIEWEKYSKYLWETKKQIPRLKIHYLVPRVPYSDEEIARMKAYADAQLGRPFGMRSYVTGKPSNTIHCCEYVGNILGLSSRYTTIGPRETPKHIYEKAVDL